MSAANGKAAFAGSGITQEQGPDCLDNNSDFVKRLYKRIARLVQERCASEKLGKLTFPANKKPLDALIEIEWEAWTVLDAEIRNFPTIAAMLPLSFRQAVQSGHLDNLTSLERAAIICAQADASRNSDALSKVPYADAFAMKCAALVFALQQGGEL